MRSGALRFEVRLQRRVDTQDSAGQVVHTYTDFGSDFAAVEDLSQREFAAVQQVQAEATTRIRMRFRADIDETCRILLTDYDADESPPAVKVYDVLGPPTVDVKTGRREITMLCARRRADGWRSGE